MVSKTILLVASILAIGTLAATMMAKSKTAPQSLNYRDFGFDNIEEFQVRLSQFRRWMAQFDKQYTTVEHDLRFRTWNENFEFVQEHNAKRLSWDLEMNEFADLSIEEFTALYLGLAAEDESIEEQENATLLDVNGLPASIDWRQKGAVSPVQSQKTCGGCYSFSAAGALEGLAKIKTGKLYNFSEQQILDCSKDYGNKGCGGGLMTKAFKYTRDKGIEKDADYTFVSKTGSCKYNAKKTVYKNTGHKMLAKGSSQLQAAAALGPVSVSVDSGQKAFQLYKSGIITSNCTTGLDHAVLVVGYATSNKIDYWIVKNSWGSKWGEQGYIRIQRGEQNGGAGLCGINK